MAGVGTSASNRCHRRRGRPHRAWQTQRRRRQQETAAANMICTHLAYQGYQRTIAVSDTRSIWTRKDQQVVVSLVDDAWDCALDRSQDTPYLFDDNTMVITDNWINTPTVYQIARLPNRLAPHLTS